MPKFKENPSPLKYGKKSSNFKMKNPIKFMGHMGAMMGYGSSSGIPMVAAMGTNPGMKRSKIYHNAPTSQGRYR